MNLRTIRLKLAISVLAIVSLNVYSLSVEEFLILSVSQKEMLDKFKEVVSSKLPHEYMRKDNYLIYWLREANFDVPTAEKMLISNIRWREEDKVDAILKENYFEFDDEFRGYAEGCDKEGRPVLSLSLGDWNIRQYALAGKIERLKRYTTKIMEEAFAQLRWMQDEGQNVTQAWFILNLDNFNLVIHGCPNCISLYIYLVSTLQYRYPGYLYRIVAINTPGIAIPLWNIYKPLATSAIRDVLVIFGKNKKQWQDFLLKEIDPSQLSEQYGGIRPEALDNFVLRQSKKIFRCNASLHWDEYFFP